MQPATLDLQDSLLASLMADESFRPTEPASLEEAGIGEECVEQLICKYLAIFGASNGRTIAEYICLPFRIIEPLLARVAHQSDRGPRRFGLLQRLLLCTDLARPHAGGSLLGRLRLRGAGARAADGLRDLGRGPVDYGRGPGTRETGGGRARHFRRSEPLRHVWGRPSTPGAGMFLYAAPGNGKSTLAKRITLCFGEEIWIPHALTVDGQLIKFYDSTFHKQLLADERGLIKCGEHDRRWLNISRPTVVVGGELTIDNLELRYDPRGNISEAPLQMKSNCGCLVIDDFGGSGSSRPSC